MNYKRRIHFPSLTAALFLLAALPSWGQSGGNGIVVDYNAPRKYVIGGIGVEGNQYIKADQIIQLTGIREGMTLTLPGDEISAIHRRLWVFIENK